MKLTSIALLTTLAVPSAAPRVTRAVANLSPTRGSAVSGRVVFTRTDGGINVSAEFEGLAEGAHGLHIHELGDCSAPDASSAGAHFNPESERHGAPGDEHRHVGDLGNVVADKAGKARLETLDGRMALDGPQGILGRSVIVHTNPDDLRTQPTGNAGGRLACAVIGVAGFDAAARTGS
jgi:Cu-Zn family superoxide dismutase